MFNFPRPAIFPNVLPRDIIRSYEGSALACLFVDGFAGLDPQKDKIFWYVTWEDADTLRIYGKVNNDKPRLYRERTISKAENMAAVFCDASYLARSSRASDGTIYEFKAAAEIYKLGREGALKQYAEYANKDAPKPPRPYR